ncbi:MAG TPA: ATP-binding protein [Ruminococcaceae bacterium]|nr:ATP-binding protein [Oscillospiraceae bacterium]
MMPAGYRIAEILVYSLLNFLPFLILALYPFRNRLRFSRSVTGLLIVLMTAVQLGLGVWAALFSNGRAGLVSMVSTVLYAAFFFLSVKISWGKALFTLLMISNTANLAVVGSKCIEGLLFPELAVQSYRWSFSLITFLVEIVFWIPIFFYMKKVYTPAVEKEPSGFEWKFLWLIPATFYLIWYYEIYFDSSQSSLQISLQPKNALFLLLINIGATLVYYVVTRLISEQGKNMELQEKNHRLAMRELQYDSLTEKIAEARRAKHDVRHHIALMQELLGKEDYEELGKYLQEYSMSVPDDTPIAFCENSAANVVIAYFAQLAKNNGIDYSVSTNIPENIKIEKTDLSVLLGNLLENATDACIENGGGKIIIRASYEARSLCFAVDNSFNGNTERNADGTFTSTKHSGRGLGIESVKSIVEKYNGICKFETDGKMFYASVMINEK